MINEKFTLLLSVMLFLSCASRREIRQFQDDMVYLRSRVESLQLENRQIWELLQDVERSLADLTEISNQNRADLLSEMSGIREKSENLQVLLDDTGQRMSRLIHIAEQPGSRSAATDTTRAAKDSADTRTPDVNPKSLYDSAYLDLSRGDYDLALRGFEEYLLRFPSTDYSDNAQYWIGEIFYAKKDYQRAFQEFEKVTVEHPRGDKVSAAYLKMAYCLMQTGDKTGARKYLNTVIERFPKSPEAQLAASRLEDL